MTVPYAFGAATSAIPLSQLDANFNTPITLGNTAIQLGNTVTTLNNMALANVTISSGNVTITNVTVTTANATTVNTTTLIATTANVTTGNVTNLISGNVTLTGGSITGTPISGSTGSFTTLTTSGTVTLNGGTANGVAYLDGSKVLTSGSGLVFDGSNLGLGVTPSAWSGSGVKAFDVGTGASFAGSGSDAGMIANAYYNGSNWIYKASSLAVRYQQLIGTGAHAWYTAASGTAGNAITFTQAMTLDASGNLGVGTTSPGSFGKLSVVGTIAPVSPDTTIQGIYSAANTGEIRLGGFKSGGGTFLVFTTGSDTERARIDSSGNLLVGTTSASTRFTLNVSGANDGITLRTTNEGAIGQLGMVNPGSNNDIQIGTLGVNNLRFFTNGTANERARITSGGYFKASNDGVYVDSAGVFHELNGDGSAETLIIDNSVSASTAAIVHTRGAANFAGTHYLAENLGTTVFQVASNGNVTNANGSYGTISDAKLKTDIVDASSQWEDLKAVRFRKFRMKNDPSGLLQLGVIAQELEQVSPGLVEEHTDRDQEGNDLGTTTKSVKTSVLLMKAAVALQEAMARIEKLEAEVATLKGA